ncbi:MAG: dicarboxylate/amino acid:cation symporter [Spirochaetales bacterium]|nr:dicarboxylate/amino acid:cation symporter [Spirochaetales bacterium]
MKLWMRILIGSVVGIVLGLYLPLAGGDSLGVIGRITEIVISIGRYALFPLVFFGVTIGVFELRSDRITGKVYGKAALIIVATSLTMVVIGALVVLLLAPRRIPPIFQEALIPSIPAIPELALTVFPNNLFAIFAQSGSYLLPIMAAALLIGLVLHAEGANAVPATDVVDSSARIFYRLNSWMVEALAVGMIAVAAYYVMRLRSVSDLQLFVPLVLVVSAIAAFFVLIALPLIAFFLSDRYSPFAWLYALVNPAIIGFFAGDSYFALGALIRVSKENYGVSRAVAAPTLTLSTIFAKSGSALVIAASFLTVLRSYTALGITVPQVLLVMLLSFSVSFLLGAVPGATVLVGLSVLAQVFGQGIDEIYLLLLPALPILTGIAVLTDTVTAAFVSFIVAQWERKRRIVDALDFI